MKQYLDGRNVFQLKCKIAAALFVAQGLLMADHMRKVAKLKIQADYLADIVRRNQEHLDEFDVIALRELGMVKKS